MNKLKGIEGVCKKCHYKSTSWHEDLKSPKCQKCGGLIKILMRLDPYHTKVGKVE